MNPFLKAVRFVVGMGDVGEFAHFIWVAVVAAFVVGAALKGMAPDQTALPIAGALLAGLAAGLATYRIEFRGRRTREQ